MALLVDPPHRDSADEKPPGEVPSVGPHETASSPVMTEQTLLPPETSEPGEHRLAEPPLTGGRVEALMGQLIRVLSHSPPAPSVARRYPDRARPRRSRVRRPVRHRPRAECGHAAGAPAADLGRAGPGRAA